MRPDRNTMSVESTLSGEDVRMGIAAGAEAHIMSILTDLYEDPELAAIREYATNAWDAHVEAGQTRPIEVTTPGALRPLFTVKDYGIGLDAEGVRRIYSQYGASTKRESDEQVGMLGVGCKSALTYTDQFTIVAVKGGRKIMVSVSRDEDGAGTMKILSDEATDESPSVEVQVPCKRDNEFATKATKFFRFWEPGQVLLNGSDPAGLPGAYELTESISVIEDDDDETDYIVMGGVPYPTDLGLYPKSRWGSNKIVVAKVGIGAVTFTPSREGLQDTDRTKKTIANVRREFTEAAKLAVQRDVDAAADRPAALQAYVAAVGNLPSAAVPNPDTVQFQGSSLPNIENIWQSRNVVTSGHAHSTGRYKVELMQITTGLWITGYTNENWAKGQRDKLLLYLSEVRKDLPDDQKQKPLFLIPDDLPPEASWIPTDHVIAWEAVKKWQPPRDPNAPKLPARKTGTYFVNTEDSQYVRDRDANDLTGKLYWVQCRKYSENARRTNLKLKAAFPNTKFTLVCLPENRVAKFERDFPKATRANDALKKHWAKKLADLTDLDREAMAFSSGEFDLDDLDEGRVEDPELQHMIVVAKRQQQRQGQYSELREAKRAYDLPDTGAKKAPQEATVTKRYPLLSQLGYGTRTTTVENHLYMYIKAAYAADKE